MAITTFIAFLQRNHSIISITEKIKYEDCLIDMTSQDVEDLIRKLHESFNSSQKNFSTSKQSLLQFFLFLTRSRFTFAFPKNRRDEIVDKLLDLLFHSIRTDDIGDLIDVLDDPRLRNPIILPQFRHIIHVGNYLCTNIVLGKGQTSTVYLGLEKFTGEKVAIKDADFKITKSRQSIVRELKIIQLINHQNTVRLYYNKEQNGHFYLVLEHCDGGTIKDYQSQRPNGRLSESEVQEIILQIANACEMLRRNKIIHRDIKPANILVKKGENGRFIFKLADFGFARELEAGALAETICGTPLYLPPEIAERRPYNEKSDLWSIGVIFYEMLYGCCPFSGKTLEELIFNVRSRNVVYPKDVVISSAARDLLDKLLKVDPDERIEWDGFFNHSFLKPAPPPSTYSSSSRLSFSSSKPSEDKSTSSIDDFAKMFINNPNEELIEHYKKRNVETETRYAALEKTNQNLQSSNSALRAQVCDLIDNVNQLRENSTKTESQLNILRAQVEHTKKELAEEKIKSSREADKARVLQDILDRKPNLTESFLIDRDATTNQLIIDNQNLYAELKDYKKRAADSDAARRKAEEELRKEKQENLLNKFRVNDADERLTELALQKENLTEELETKRRLLRDRDDTIDTLNKELIEMRTNFGAMSFI